MSEELWAVRKNQCVVFLFLAPRLGVNFFSSINDCCLYSGLKICIPSIGNLLAVVQFPHSEANVF